MATSAIGQDNEFSTIPSIHHEFFRAWIDCSEDKGVVS